MLSEIFDPSRIKLDLESTTKTDVLGELVETITLPGYDLNRQKLLEAVTLRENKMNTIILPGIAVPHGYCSNVHGIIGAIGFSRDGIEYDNLDQTPVHLFFMLLMDEKSRERHLVVFKKLLELLHSTGFTEIYEKRSPQKLCDLIRQL